MGDTRQAVNSLSVLKDQALLLSMANEYLCEDLFLIKFGNDISRSLQRLKGEIAALKKEFPGKFTTEIETDSLLAKINKTAQAMINSEREIRKRCSSGALGSKLESDIRLIENAVEEIRLQVYGESVTYTKKDSVAGLIDGVKSLGSSIGRLIILSMKIASGLIIVTFILFLYLFFTMEKEEKYLKKIDQNQAYITSQKDELSRLNLKKDELSKEIKALDSQDLKRDSKIAILDKDVEIHNINLESKKIEAELIEYEKRIIEYQGKIKDIRKTPFLKRLLRQAD